MKEGLVLVLSFPEEYDNPTYHFITFVTRALSGMTTWSEHINISHEKLNLAEVALEALEVVTTSGNFFLRFEILHYRL